MQANVYVNDEKELIVDMTDVYDKKAAKLLRNKDPKIRWRLDYPADRKNPVLNLESVHPKIDTPVFSKELDKKGIDSAKIISGCMHVHGYYIVKYRNRDIKLRENRGLLAEMKKRIWGHDKK